MGTLSEEYGDVVGRVRGGYLKGLGRVSGGCGDAHWRVKQGSTSGWCGKAVWNVSRGCGEALEGVWRLSGGCGETVWRM